MDFYLTGFNYSFFSHRKSAAGVNWLCSLDANAWTSIRYKKRNCQRWYADHISLLLLQEPFGHILDTQCKYFNLAYARSPRHKHWSGWRNKSEDLSCRSLIYVPIANVDFNEQTVYSVLMPGRNAMSPFIALSRIDRRFFSNLSRLDGRSINRHVHFT